MLGFFANEKLVDETIKWCMMGGEILEFKIYKKKLVIINNNILTSNNDSACVLKQ